MFLEYAKFINRAPFDSLTLKFKESGINVLTAINGSGKTTILSHIVDALHEMARPHFPLSYSNIENQFYRYSSSLFHLDPQKYSLVYLRFRDENEIYDYIDCRNEISEEEYNNAVNLDDKIPFEHVNSTLSNESFIKIYSQNLSAAVAKRNFNGNVLTYFPSYRYEQPVFLNDPYQVQIPFSMTQKIMGCLPNPIEVVSGLEQLACWIMDVVLDWEIYRNIKTIPLSDNSRKIIDTSPESTLFNNLNCIVAASLSSKYKGKLSVNDRIRLGIGKRDNSGRRVSIVLDKGNDNIVTIAPNIFCLSSGEASLFSLFGEILRQADNLKSNIPLDEIQGIVIIDEIDKHLHIRLQKEVLPSLMSLLPNIQFIVSSHSPFFNMGLAEIIPERSQIIDLDNHGFVIAPENNRQYQEVYEMMLDANNQFSHKYYELRKVVDQLNKPVILTEGKTDIKHILKAKETLKITDLNFECVDESNQPNGDQDLYKLLEQLSKIPQPHPIIGIFDRDNSNIRSKIEGENNNQFRNFGNNVFAFCIKAPAFRTEKHQTEISIEYLYSDEEIKTMLKTNCRLFFGTEFTRQSMRHNECNDLSLAMPNGKGKDKILENNGGQAVYKTAGSEETNVLAKKDDFAEAIKNNEINISADSWSNFSHIFDTIREILNIDPTKSSASS